MWQRGFWPLGTTLRMTVIITLPAGAGFIMLAVTIVGSIFSLGLAGLAMVVISIVEGVLYLSKSQTEFEQIYVFNKKEWF